MYFHWFKASKHPSTLLRFSLSGCLSLLPQGERQVNPGQVTSAWAGLNSYLLGFIVHILYPLPTAGQTTEKRTKMFQQQECFVPFLFVLVQQFKSTSHCIYWDAKVCIALLHSMCRTLISNVQDDIHLHIWHVNSQLYSKKSCALRTTLCFYKSKESAAARNMICRSKQAESG